MKKKVTSEHRVVLATLSNCGKLLKLGLPNVTRKSENVWCEENGLNVVFFLTNKTTHGQG
jgi:hypothetical protein